MSARTLDVGVVGAAGVVGAEILRQLDERGFPCGRVRAFGSVRTAGMRVDVGDVEIPVELVDAASNLDVVFLAGGPALSRAHGARLAGEGSIVVDVSSAHRDDPAATLVVPELNGTEAMGAGGRILALPSPTTMVAAIVLAPLMTIGAVSRVGIATYQGVGSAGTRALRRLGLATARLLGGRGAGDDMGDDAFECRPIIGRLESDGRSSHERAVASELARLLASGLPRVHLTAVRVPVFSGIGMAMTIEFASGVDASGSAEILRTAPGVIVHQDDVPTLRGVTGSLAVHVGRIRRDESHENAIALWAAADAVLKGKAGAAVAVAELAIRGPLS